MPEGPELHLASRFINKIASDRVFTGQVKKSEVSLKNPEVDWNEKNYSISACSRGKEVKISLTALDDVKNSKVEGKPAKPLKTLDLLFRFGMSGCFRFDHVKKMHKHAHLNFFSKDDDMVLSFVDVRRFGRWEVDGTWGVERGPCVLQEYSLFRPNVLNNLEDPAFNRPICEALLNQKFFNGIGNYLRAEILFRAGIRPFDKARDVLQPLKDTEDTKIKTEKPDVLQLCTILPNEVINLGGGKGYDPEATEDDYSAFSAWLQCYYNPSMDNLADHNKRTMWFQGDPGPMVPKDPKSKARKGKTKLDKKDSEGSSSEQSPVKKNTRTKVKALAEHSYTKKASQRKRAAKSENTPTGTESVTKVKRSRKETSAGQKTSTGQKKPATQKRKSLTKLAKELKATSKEKRAAPTKKTAAKSQNSTPRVTGSRRSARLSSKAGTS